MAWTKDNEYSRRATSVAQKHLSPEKVKEWYASLGRTVSEEAIRAEVQTDERLHRAITVFVGSRVLVRFYLAPYPCCCAMQQFYGFSYGEYIPTLGWHEATLHNLMDDLLEIICPLVGNWASRRLIVMMKEYRGEVYEKSPGFVFEDLKPVGNPSITYPGFYSYFLKQKKVNERLMWNANTGNIIHDMEVLFDQDKFPAY